MAMSLDELKKQGEEIEERIKAVVEEIVNGSLGPDEPKIEAIGCSGGGKSESAAEKGSRGRAKSMEVRILDAKVDLLLKRARLRKIEGLK